MKTSKFFILCFAFFLLYFITACQDEDEKYTITFVTGTDITVDEQVISYLEDLILPELTKEGYTFTGWTYSIGNETFNLSELSVLINDLELHAEWSINDYVISFVTYTDEIFDPQTFTYQSDLSLNLVPERDGYTFENWYLDAEFTEIFTFESMPAANITLYAKWTTDEYTLSFETYTDQMIEPILYVYDDEFTLPTEPTRLGYSFQGWYMDENFGDPFDIDLISTSTTLYAKWEINDYELILYSDHFENPQVLSISYDEVLDISSNLSYEGFTFDGWYMDINYQIPFTLLNMPANNLNLYAKWIRNSYTLSFNSGTDEIIDSIQRLYDEPINLQLEIENEGYTFDGWYLDQEYTQLFTYQNMPAMDITIYAKWTINSYTLTFVSDDSILSSYILMYQETIELPFSPSKDGHTFVGWTIDQEFLQILNFNNMPAYNLTLYAKWVPNTYQITLYDFSGEILDVIDYVYLEELNILEPKMNHQMFLGWYHDQDFIVPFVDDENILSNLSLYSKWRDKTLSDYIEEAKNASHYMLTYYRYEDEMSLFTSQRQDNTYRFYYKDINMIEYADFTEQVQTFYNKNQSFDLFSVRSYNAEMPLYVDSHHHELLYNLNPNWFIYENGSYVFYPSLFYNEPDENLFFDKLSGAIYLTEQGFTIEMRMSELDIEYYVVNLYDLEPIELPTNTYVLEQNDLFSFFVYEEEVYLDKYIGLNQDLIIPEFIDGKPVVAIEPNFSNIYLHSLTIPKTVRYIARYAFSWQDGMQNVNIPSDSQLEYIGEYAFSRLNSIIFLPSSISFIGKEAFSSTRILFSDQVDTSTFDPSWNGDNSPLMNALSLHETDDFYYALMPNSEITIIKVKESVQLLEIPRMIDNHLVTAIHDFAFSRTLLNEISFEEGIELKTIGNYAFFGNNLNQEIILPSSIEEIGDYAFAASGLISISFEENSLLHTIGDYAFHANLSLLETFLPSGIQHIGESIYQYNSGILYIDEPFMNPNWNQNFIDQDINVIWNLNKDTFVYDEILYQIINANEVMIIDQEFTTVPSTLTIPEIVMGYHVTKIGQSSFANLSISNIILPQTITHIYQKAFENNSELVDLNFEDLVNLEYIGNYAFKGTSLNEVMLPNNLRYIGFYAFSQVDMDVLVLPSSNTLEIIEYRAFETYQHAIFISDSIDYVGYQAFRNADFIYTSHLSYPSAWARQSEMVQPIYYGVKSFDINNDYKYTVTINDEITIISYIGSDLDVIIPNQIIGLPVTSLYDSSFRNSPIDSVVIPNTISKLGIYVFSESDVSVVSFESGSLINEIPLNAFAYTYQLSSINLEVLTELEIIGTQAFTNTSSLIDVTIPSSVRIIKEGAFYSSAIHSLNFLVNSELEVIEASAFHSAAYMQYFDTYNLSQLVFIGHNAFGGTTSLINFFIPISVKIIGISAFADSSIQTIFIEASAIPNTWYYDWIEPNMDYILNYTI